MYLKNTILNKNNIDVSYDGADKLTQKSYSKGKKLESWLCGHL